MMALAFSEISRKRLVSEDLHIRGFVRERNPRIRELPHAIDAPYLGWCWKGKLVCHLGELSIRLLIKDWNFLTLPSLYIEQPLPVWLECHQPMAHITPESFWINEVAHVDLCYSVSDAAELPRQQPTAIIEWILNQAQSIVNQLSTDALFRQQELWREIEPIWTRLQNYQLQQALLFERHELLPTFYGSVRVNVDVDQPLVHKKVDWTLRQFGAEKFQINYRTFFLRVGSKKIPPLRWLYESISKNTLDRMGGATDFSQFLTWLKAWDRTAHHELITFLHNNWHLFQKITLIPLSLITANSIPLSVLIVINNKSVKPTDAKPSFALSWIKKLPAQFSQMPVCLFTSENLIPQYLYQRNLTNMTMKNLAGLRIAIIGCGAIGGYLASGLARLGAGTNGGELLLIDPDSFEPHNLGRHYLGKTYLGHNKANALKAELEYQLVALNIRAMNKSALDYSLLKQLVQIDLVIDASGKMELSETLSEYWHTQHCTHPLLHLWIQGNGECVQGLLVEPNTPYACRSCIRETGQVTTRQSELAPLGADYEAHTAFLACSQFTPYAVSAGLSAASLGTDIVLDWVNGQSSPRYRTRYVERWQGVHTPSQDVQKSPECPFCNPTISEVSS